MVLPDPSGMYSSLGFILEFLRYMLNAECSDRKPDLELSPDAVPTDPESPWTWDLDEFVIDATFVICCLFMDSNGDECIHCIHHLWRLVCSPPVDVWGLGMLNRNLISGGPWLLVCLGGGSWCTLWGLGWLMGHRGVGCLMVWSCCCVCGSVSLLQLVVSKLGYWAFAMVTPFQTSVMVD